MTTVPDRTSQPDVHPGSAVPWRLRAAAEWSWRLLVIGVAGYVLTVVLREFSEIAVPVAVATLLAALLAPANTWLRARMPKVAAAATCVVGLIIVVGTLLTLVGSQVSGGMGELTAKVVTGLDQVREWVRSTFHITDSQFTTYFEQLKSTISAGGNLGSTAAKAGLTATHFVAGTFLALFSLIFFLYDGRRIASWLVGLFPRSARAKVDGAATIAWEQLTSFVRATVLVAFVDAVGIGLGAAVLRVPFAGAIFVLVFLGSFVPIVGALVSGAVAVLLALVAHGPVMALVMLGVVLAVQQLEAHILQPFLLGRAVAIHPLGVVLGIGLGVVVAGVVGALFAVPTIAVANAVGKYLLADDPSGPPVVALASDPGMPDQSSGAAADDEPAGDAEGVSR